MNMMHTSYFLDFLERYSRRLLWGVIGGAFLVSLFYSFYYRIEPMVDAEAYNVIAQNIISGNGYRMDTNDIPLNADRSMIKSGPGYEFLLVGFFYVFGHRYEPVWIFQALFHALSALLVFLISRRLFKDMWHPAMGLTGAALIAFSPDLILASSMLLVENFALFLMLLFVWWFFRYDDMPSASGAGLAGVLFGAVYLTRSPLGILLLPASALFWVRKRFVHAIVFLFCCAILMAPWAVRNYRVFHKFVPTNLAVGDAFLNGNNPNATGEIDDSRYEYTTPLRFAERFSANKTEIDMALGFIKADPLRFLKITFYRVSIYFSIARPTGWWPYLEGMRFQQLAVVVSSAVYAFVLFLLGGAGVLGAITRTTGQTRQRVLFFTVMLILMPVSFMFLIVETRYRYSAYPFMALFAGYAFTLLMRERNFFDRALLISFSLFSLNTLFDVARNFQRILDRI